MFMLQSLEYYSSMFDGIMLSGDDSIAHYLILIKPESSKLLHSPRSPTPCRSIPLLKLSELSLGCSLTPTLSYSSLDTRDASLGMGFV